jgi:hypothetical protein
VLSQCSHRWLAQVEARTHTKIRPPGIETRTI